MAQCAGGAASVKIETWLADKTKYEVPCAPVLSMKKLAYDPALRTSGTIVEVGH